ncbi:hypothetical protein [Dehalobacterium formicoaceticum]|uniref:Uncharacterized protein n=1 Tax=Dehalobacterium formicoaceticum TaxID=51515 RepID=A0ABT1Y178_9FIRM|nr:hypothetical protein [Dehalobacterium formicoaceticum]MCR6544625.1 hypothetical protein [Dehalobacterium formicoaceticum]
MNQTSVQIPTSRSFLVALPWVIMILVFAFLSWLFWEPFLSMFMDAESAQYASIGISTMGAYLVSIFGIAGQWPFQKVENRWVKGILLILLAKVIAAAFWIVLVRFLHVNIVMWAFPIISNSWLILAATSFIGGDAHLPNIPPVRKMFLNLLIAVGGTIVLLRTIVIFPSTWFAMLQPIIITGGLAYLFRRVKQPTFSILSWSLLLGLMWIFVSVASWLGHFTIDHNAPQFWTWNLGAGSAEFNLFFAFTCGLNFAVFACTQAWPFCRIRQPWGTTIALLSVLTWCYLITLAIIPLFNTLVPGDTSLWQAQVFAWHTVFWGFSWVYCFGIGQQPYLWKGQKTPGTWDDVD